MSRRDSAHVLGEVDLPAGFVPPSAAIGAPAQPMPLRSRVLTILSEAVWTHVDVEPETYDVSRFSDAEPTVLPGNGMTVTIRLKLHPDIVAEFIQPPSEELE